MNEKIEKICSNPIHLDERICGSNPIHLDERICGSKPIHLDEKICDNPICGSNPIHLDEKICDNPTCGINLLHLDDEIEKICSNLPHHPSILVMSGGGIKGIAHLGAMKALKEQGLMSHIDTLACSSVGSFLGFLYNVGYEPEEIFEFVYFFDFKKIVTCKLKNIFSSFGLNDGVGIMILLSKLVEMKGIKSTITFGELYEQTHMTLIVAASCVNDKEMYYFSHNTYPNMQVITAVRMSIAVPIYFTPVIFENKIFLDSGCIDNYPIQMFNDRLNDVIGLYLSSEYENVDDITNVEIFLVNLVDCFTRGISMGNLKGYEKCTVNIKIPDVYTTQFDLDKQGKQTLYEIGYDSVMKSDISHVN